MDKSKDKEIHSHGRSSQTAQKKYLTFAERVTRTVEICCKVAAALIILITFTWHIARLQFEGILFTEVPCDMYFISNYHAVSVVLVII